MAVGYGPLYRIDGPLPLQPRYGLLQAASSESVRIIADVDESGIDRWINGVEVYPYPTDFPGVFDACATGSNVRDKSAGTLPSLPQFGALTVYLAETCTPRGIADQAAFKARAVAAFSAVEGAAVEQEFLSGRNIPLNPHLADGNGTFPWGNTATTVANGFAVLENAIAASGRAGLIHASPATVTAAAVDHVVDVDPKSGVLRTMNGTVVIAGSGYAQGHPPLGVHPNATATQEWIYASGPVDIRRSEIFMIPENVSEAMDRAQNLVTYRAERYYVVDWDTVVQSAVLVDRCTTVCGTPA
jgi:hypothetical protein